jgi:hypothetical protein
MRQYIKHKTIGGGNTLHILNTFSVLFSESLIHF